MNLWPLLAHLEQSGVLLTTHGEGSRLRVKSEKPISNAVKKLLAAHKDELLDLIVTLEETAAILEVNQGLSPSDARREAGQCVRGDLSLRGDEWVREMVVTDSDFQAACDVFGGLEIITVERLAA